MKNSQILAAIVTSLVILEILSIATCDSFIPWAVLSHDKIGFRILGWIFSVQICVSIFAFIFLSLLPDKNCSICQCNLRLYIPVYGMPVMCPVCRTLYHQKCLKAKNNQCPECKKRESDVEHDFVDDYMGYRNLDSFRRDNF